MRISKNCAACLYDRQRQKNNDPEYLARVKDIIDHRGEEDTSPYMIYLFNKVQEELYGKTADYGEIKKSFNDLILGMETRLRREIEEAENPLAKAFVMARNGNYIDFGALNHVDTETFLRLLMHTELREDDRKTYASFLKECEKADRFLLICDNCGEIVLDKLFIEQLSLKFPGLRISAMVRGKDVLNDATKDDAIYVELDRVANIVSNGEAIAGTIYDMLPDSAKEALNEADVILAKGQGNYESMAGRGYHAFYAFLCKCDLFTSRFDVPRLTGIFVEEKAENI